jgi:hypothetical protein
MPASICLQLLSKPQRKVLARKQQVEQVELAKKEAQVQSDLLHKWKCLRAQLRLPCMETRTAICLLTLFLPAYNILERRIQASAPLLALTDAT